MYALSLCRAPLLLARWGTLTARSGLTSSLGHLAAPSMSSLPRSLTQATLAHPRSIHCYRFTSEKVIVNSKLVVGQSQSWCVRFWHTTVNPYTETMACYSNSQTIPDQAREMVKDVFKHQSEAATPGQWCTLTPKEIKSLDCAPSQSSTYYFLEHGSEDKVIMHLAKEFNSILTDVGHVQTFWEDFSMNVSYKLGLPYREAQKMDSPTYSEAKLRHHVLHPILKEVSKAICIHPKFEGETISMDYIIEDELKVMNGRSGQKPSVDAVIQVNNADGKTLALVPVEMKIDMDIKDYSQIACYVNKLSSVEDVRDYIMVGIIIDKKQFRLAFSACCSQTVPLPIVHISPPIAWKTNSFIHEPSMLVLACSFLIGQVKRLEYPASVTQEITSSLVSLSTLKAMGEKLCKHPVVLYKPEQERLGFLPLKRKINQQQDKIDQQQDEIDQQQAKVDQQQGEIEKLKEAIEGLENTINRGRKSPRK